MRVLYLTWLMGVLFLTSDSQGDILPSLIALKGYPSPVLLSAEYGIRSNIETIARTSVELRQTGAEMPE